jgi:hypothetical protein
MCTITYSHQAFDLYTELLQLLYIVIGKLVTLRKVFCHGLVIFFQTYSHTFKMYYMLLANRSTALPLMGNYHGRVDEPFSNEFYFRGKPPHSSPIGVTQP